MTSGTLRTLLIVAAAAGAVSVAACKKADDSANNSAAASASDANAAMASATAELTDPAAGGSAGPHPLDQWPVAEAGLRLDDMKARIADITHPWPLVADTTPDLGGQRLIGIYAMRHEVAEGAARVHDLLAQLSAAPAVAAR